jgi:DNA-binding NarL/FixJ family response regulator
VVASLANVLTGRVGLSPIMVGRRATLDRLRGVIDMGELHSSDLPSVALIAGEAGIGKTRLLREMLALLPRDVTVFSASAEPRATARAFDVATQLVAGREGEDPAALVLEVVGAAVGRGRVAVVVEDLHWIDSDSVGVLDAIARQPWPNLVVIGTYRPSDLARGAPGGDFLFRLERRNEVEQFRLERLDRTEVAALMGAIAGQPASSAAVEAVHRRSGGVPFVIEELIRCAGPEACSLDYISVQLPWSLEEAVRQQLTGLLPAERTVVDALAVFGQPAGFDVLTAVTGFAEAELLMHLRPMVERGLIEETRTDRLWFNHALVAESVRQQLLGRERRRLHEACFDVICSLAPDDYAALALHADGAGRYEQIVEIARTGSRAYLDRGATFQALRLASLGLSENAGDPALLAVATQAAWRIDFVAEALEFAAEWVQAAPDLAERIDAMRYVARLHLEMNNLAASATALGELIELAGTLPSGAELARAQAAIAQLMMLRRDDSAADWARAAIAEATAAGDDAVRVQAEIELASVCSQREDRVTALAALRSAADQARQLRDGVLLSRALNNSVELLPPLSPESVAVREELRRTAMEYGLDKLGHRVVMWQDALASSARADLTATKRLISEWATWTPTATDSPHYLPQVLMLAVEEGLLADASSLLARIDAAGSGGCRLDAEIPRLNLAAITRNESLGRETFERILRAEPLTDAWYSTAAVVQMVTAALEVGVGPIEVRTELLGRSLAGHPSHERLQSVAEGFLALAEGDSAGAVIALRDALAAAADIVPRWIEGTMRAALAQALLAEGRRAEALIEARIAGEVLERWPGWRRDRAEALLARLEGSSVRAVGTLTARESEVAALIADGLTNGQLAERLFISPKTAAVHVSNILAKLGLSSRTEIAAWSIRRELPAAG